MQHIWWLYLLVFIFGYVTCKTFYFLKEVRLGLVMLRLSHYLSLYTISKGIENLEYTKAVRLNDLRLTNESEKNIEAFKLNFWLFALTQDIARCASCRGAHHFGIPFVGGLAGTRYFNTKTFIPKSLNFFAISVPSIFHAKRL